MKKLTQSQRVKYAILNAPYLISKYRKLPFNKELTDHILNKYVNRSIGIEIECFGSLSHQFYDNKICRRYEDHKTIICNYYNIMSYGEDGVCDENDAEIYNRQSRDEQDFNEHKMRISNWEQLTGLYEILQDMKKYCRINTGSGIHLHIDITDIITKSPFGIVKTMSGLANYLEPKLDMIERIFFPNGGNTGTYNRKEVKVNSKGGWLNIREMSGSTYTVEFRLAPQTFEYKTIIKWIVDCTKLLNSAKYQLFKTYDTSGYEKALTNEEAVSILVKFDASGRYRSPRPDLRVIHKFIYCQNKYHIYEDHTYTSVSD